MGKAEEEAWAQKGDDCLQEKHWPEADECCHAEETVGDDEGTVGSEEKVESIVQGPGWKLYGKVSRLARDWYIPNKKEQPRKKRLE